MTRRAEDHRAFVRLVMAGMLVLGIVVAGVGNRHSIAASAGCDAVNGTSPFMTDDYAIPDFSWDAGEEVVFNAAPYVGNPTSMQILANGTPVAIGSFPGSVSYSIPTTGQIAMLRLVIDQGTAIFTVTCAAPPTVTPTTTTTNTPTQSPTSAHTDTPTSSPTNAAATPTTSPTETPTQTATNSAVSTSTNTPTRTPTATATKTPTKTSTATATPLAGVTITPLRQTVNAFIHYTIVGYPHNAAIDVTWRRISGSIINIATVQTNATGVTTGQFRVPATTGGKGQLITFKSGNVSKTVSFEVAPRIKVTTNPAVRGQFVDVSLRGYAKNESVRIRWKNGSSWVTLATIVTSNTGSANVSVKVPMFAPNGFNSVRGDGTVLRQQTNAVNVDGGPGPAASGYTAGTTSQSVGGMLAEFLALAIPSVGLGMNVRRRRQP